MIGIHDWHSWCERFLQLSLLIILILVRDTHLFALAHI